MVAVALLAIMGAQAGTTALSVHVEPSLLPVDEALAGSCAGEVELLWSDTVVIDGDDMEHPPRGK